MSKVLNDLLRELRLRAFPDLNTREVARKLGTSQSYLSKVETGYLTYPDEKTLKAMIEAYNVSYFFRKVIEHLRAKYMGADYSIPQLYGGLHLFINTGDPLRQYPELKVKLINTSSQLHDFEINHIGKPNVEAVLSCDPIYSELLRCRGSERDELMAGIYSAVDSGTLSILSPIEVGQTNMGTYVICIDNIILIDPISYQMDARGRRQGFWEFGIERVKKVCPTPLVQKLWLNRIHQQAIADEEFSRVTKLIEGALQPNQGEAAAPSEPS